MIKFCSKCKQDKEFSEFSQNKSKKDGLQTHCKLCRSVYLKSWYKDNKSLQISKVKKSKILSIKRYQKFILDFLKTHPCVDCNNSNILCLDFDHLEDKKYNIAEMKGVSLFLLKKEIEKCVIRCANCHRIKTAKERNDYKYQSLNDAEYH